MNTNNKRVRKLFQITLVWLMWYGLGLAAVSFSIDKLVKGIIELIVVGILFVILFDGRLLRKLHERPIPGRFLLGMYVIIFIGIEGVIRDFRLNDIYLLGELYVPGVIIYARSVGIIILTAILLWETIALTRQHFASKQ